ncbi:LysR family transcriptional regulator [Desulfotruncus arcticus]|uniref:LysR family transcriptional regulator n=1 Tax=Desulfotruncus arcticus TaxID=341036 RepID=UPI003390463C
MLCRRCGKFEFQQGAKRLKIAQPPLSQQIQQLEDELGIQLFLRNKHQIKLTYAGQVFWEKTNKILSDWVQR